MTDKESEDKVSESLEKEKELKTLVKQLSQLKPFEGDEIVPKFIELLYGKGFDVKNLDTYDAPQN